MDTAAATMAPADLELHDLAAERSCAPGAATATIVPARDAIDSLRAEWENLAQRPSEADAFSEYWFVAAGLRHLAGAQDVRIVEARNANGELIGLLPVTIAPRYGRMPVRHVQNWLHFHSFLGAPLVRAGRERDFWTAVLDALDNARWASGFLHINGLVDQEPVHRGLIAAAAQLRRSCDTVYRTERALLESRLSPSAYYEATVRKKKRKELKRLQARLAELGEVRTHRLSAASDLDRWCDEFLALERSGWKGKAGSALACRLETEAFFRKAVAGAHRAGRLDFLRLDLDGRALAMLVNFITPPGSFSFKIAFDEAYARFSPGVLLQIENLQILDRPGVAWMDSCAVEDHPMINSLWGERRAIVRVSVPLAGARRQATFRLCRAAEELAAVWRRRFSPSRANDQQEQANDD